jgi:hypothetical protein
MVESMLPVRLDSSCRLPMDFREQLFATSSIGKNSFSPRWSVRLGEGWFAAVFARYAESRRNLRAHEVLNFFMANVEAV